MSVAMEYQTWTPRFAERDDQQQQALLDDARAGSRDAYGELLGLHSPTMLAYFGRRLRGDLRSKVSESDLVQEACLNAIAGHLRRNTGRIAEAARPLAGR
jgi:DNA-directed RNA polymerase specialized sigma24 family protein